MATEGEVTTLEQLAEARALLNATERKLTLMRGTDVRDRELGDALARIQEAHALLWRYSRRVTGDDPEPQGGPLMMSLEYVAWVLADRNADHWTADLLRLFAKADPGRRALLAKLFPAEAKALEQWQRAPFGDVPEWRRDR